MKLSRVDREALTRAIEICRTPRKDDPGRPEQIDHFLATRPWFNVATFAAQCCQRDALRPKLWQPTPCRIADVEATLARGNDGINGAYAAAKLLKRMLAAGLSRYEPEPLKALAEAAQARRQRAKQTGADTIPDQPLPAARTAVEV